MMPTSASPPVTTAAAARTVNYVEIPARYRKELCLHTAVPETPAAAVQLTGCEPLFLVMNSRSGKQDSEATRQAIRTACAEAGRRRELLVVERGADLASAARKAVTLAREQGGIVVAVGGDGTLNAVCQAVVGQGVPFGVLPQGTFNYFGRAHGISQDTGQAMHDLLNARLEHISLDRKSTRLNSSHVRISYAVFCLKKKKNNTLPTRHRP